MSDIAPKKLNTIKMTIEYNGSCFCGWQEQPGLRSIQGELLRVLETILRTPVYELTAAGRTDTGVHARGQVVSFKTEADCNNLGKVGYGVTSLLREEVSVLEIELAKDDFNARFSEHIKQYTYRIFTRLSAPILDKDFVWHVKCPLNLELMQEAAAVIIGQHDFTSLRSSDCVAKSPVRTILESEVIKKENELHYRVVAKGFLKQMVRNISGTLVGIGMGRLSDMKAILAAKDRAKAGMTAPAKGLTIDWVRYSA